MMKTLTIEQIASAGPCERYCKPDTLEPDVDVIRWHLYGQDCVTLSGIPCLMHVPPADRLWLLCYTGVVPIVCIENEITLLRDKCVALKGDYAFPFSGRPYRARILFYLQQLASVGAKGFELHGREALRTMDANIPALPDLFEHTLFEHLLARCIDRLTAAGLKEWERIDANHNS